MDLREVHGHAPSPKRHTPWTLGWEDDDILRPLQYGYCPLPGVLPGRPEFTEPEDFASGCKDEWDRQMKKDFEDGGPLRQMAEEALKEHREGRTEPLPGTEDHHED